MLWPRGKQDVARLGAQRLQIRECSIHRGGDREDTPICGDAEEGAGDEVDDRERRSVVDDPLQPGPCQVEVGMVVAMGREDHVDVKQLQRTSAIPPSPSRISARARLERRSMPA